ncbi:hypothetical protein V8G57_15515 [Collimonas sp. H4R21]|uniref:Uncharacterized protein n=1 Tax=Collimonas rhizosphaerae TaxID=3126357 RepID=A0ABU9PXS9_9BURK
MSLALSEILAQYRAGERGLPSYTELVEIEREIFRRTHERRDTCLDQSFTFDSPIDNEGAVTKNICEVGK